MKKKLFSFLMMLCVSIGAWAYDVSGTDVSGSSSGDTQTITSTSAGALKTWFDGLTDDEKTSFKNEASSTKLVISGPMNADDFSVITGETWAKFVEVDMSGVTVTDASDIEGINLTGAEKIILPGLCGDYAEASSTMWPVAEWVVGGQAGATLGVYTKEAGNVRDALTYAGVSGSTAYKNLKMAGSLNWYDFEETNNKWNSTDGDGNLLTYSGLSAFQWSSGCFTGYIDFSDVIFEPMTINGDEVGYNECIMGYDNHGGLVHLLNWGASEIMLPEYEGYTTIPENAFFGATNLKNITIPSNYTTIEDYAFKNCSGLTRITIGRSVTSVGVECFEGCSSLETIEFAKGISDLNFDARSFAGIGSLKHVVLPEGVTNLGEAMFQQCTNLASVRLPSTLKNIGNSCFAGCSALTQITIPEGVETLGQGVFGNSGLRDVYVMATSVDKLPLIYPFCKEIGNQGFATSTFGRAKLVANNNQPISKADMAVKTTEEVTEAWHNESNGVCFLHYNPDIRDYIDYNPWYEGTDSQKEGTPAETEYLSDSYIAVDSEGKTWPVQNDGTFRGDYSRVLYAGLTAGSDKIDGDASLIAVMDDSQPSREAWRQFILKNGDAKNGESVLTKEYKDVWYTMCFPFHLNDEQLEEAFNAEYNICEFNNVEIKTNDEGSKYIVLHFNTIAPELTIDGNKYLAKAYHPYMIHPNLGLNENSSPVKCHFTGLKKVAEDAITETTPYCDGTLNNVKSQGVVQTATDTDSGATGTFYFIGNVDDPEEVVTVNTNIYVGREVAEDGDTGITTINAGNAKGIKLIPYGAYFLGTAKGAKYPKYWRETSTDYMRTTGKWSQYAAIVLSDQKLEKALYTNANNAKSFDIDFTEYFSPEEEEMGIATELEGIIEEAVEKKQPVQFVNIVYNINGQVVKSSDDSLENLPKGMYIVNGKKYLVK